MASWLRLWHDMPNDPKWRTIARISSQPISLVQATYLHLLVDASRNVTRGHADVTIEDLASALDVSEDAISAIIDAMQGRVLDGFDVTGWVKRQPSREDAVGIENGAKSAAERKRAQREREREEVNFTQCHEESRNVTQCHAPDTDTDTDTEKEKLPRKRAEYSPDFLEWFAIYPKHRKPSKAEAFKQWKSQHVNGSASILIAKLKDQIAAKVWDEGDKFCPNAQKYLKERRWESEVEQPRQSIERNPWDGAS